MSAPALQEIVCCMGQPVGGNPTQYMFEKAFLAAGLDWRYLTLEVSSANLADAVRGMKAMGFRGGNFTIPHKVAVIPLLDGLSEAAAMMGAVNCAHREGDKLLGENTDGKGFVQSLKGLVDPAGKRVMILGAGGAARAIGVELALAGATNITVVNRGAPRGEELAELLRERSKAQATYAPLNGQLAIPLQTDIFINATSIGLNDESARVPVVRDTLRPGLIVADVVFNPAETRLLAEAKDNGCHVLDGLGMLVNQAVISYRIWTGSEPDAAVMREALEEFLAI
ncbi:MAG TPA: shikimate dehydrogenase [Pirellulaceae bacterium]|nr:shikimate dehydrogenase [Pirellulaceae bacterium]